MTSNLFPTTFFSRNLAQHPLFSMQKEMNKLFEDFVDEGTLTKSAKGLSPRMDIVEDEKAYHVSTELPGVEEKDIHLAIKDGILTVKAEKKSTHESTEKGKHYSERSYGLFERSVRVGDEVLEDGIAAHFKNGVLNITLPKREPSKPVEKKIEIKTN